MSARPKSARAISIYSTPGASTAKAQPRSPWPARRRRSRWTSASATAKGRRCRPSSRIFSAPTPTAFGAATPARAIRSRSRPLPAKAKTCSATAGTARSARPRIWPRPRLWAATPLNAPSAACGPAKSPPPNARCCLNPLWPPACWGHLCKLSAAARSTARALFCSTAWASACFRHIWTFTRTPSCKAAKAARLLTTRACVCRHARWSSADA